MKWWALGALVMTAAIGPEIWPSVVTAAIWATTTMLGTTYQGLYVWREAVSQRRRISRLNSAVTHAQPRSRDWAVAVIDLEATLINYAKSVALLTIHVIFLAAAWLSLPLSVHPSPNAILGDVIRLAYSAYIVYLMWVTWSSRRRVGRMLEARAILEEGRS